MEKNKKHPSPQEKLKIIALYKKGKSVADLSEFFSFHPMTIYRWIREHKVKASFERKEGSGRPSKIEGKCAKKLLEILKRPATDFGFETMLWNTQRIKIVCKKKLNINVSNMAVWRFLKKMNYTCKKVQKTYSEASQKDKNEWTQNTVCKIKKK